MKSKVVGKTAGLLYLLGLLTLMIVLRAKYADMPAGEMFRAERLRHIFGFLLTLLTFVGDAGHLVPRIFERSGENRPRKHFYRGLGDIISLIAMILFFNVLIRMGDSLEYSNLYIVRRHQIRDHLRRTHLCYSA